MKNILVTGASRGVGYALASKFLSEGYSVFCASRNLKPLQELEQKHQMSCTLIRLDLEEEESILSAAQYFKENAIQLDIVVHNAGAIINKPFADITRKELEMCYNVNVLGPFQITQNLVPLLKEDAHVVFISSMGGFQGTQKFPGLTAYSSSKSAVASLTECLQEEFKETKLAFNCICLGAIQTEMLANAFPGYQAPLNPEQISEYICQFSTTAHRYLKGKVLPVSLSTP